MNQDDLIELILAKTGTGHLNVGANILYDQLPVCADDNDYENLPIMIDSIIGHYGQGLVVDIGSYMTSEGKYGRVNVDAPPGGQTRFATMDGANSSYVFIANTLGQHGLRGSHFSIDGTIPYVENSASAANLFANTPQVVAGGLANGWPTFGPFAVVPESVDIQSGGKWKTMYALDAHPLAYISAAGGAAVWRMLFPESLTEKVSKQVAKDYYYQYYAQYDYTFVGVQPWQQTRFDDYMVFRQTWNPRTQTYDAFTRVCSRQPNATGEWAGTSNSRKRVIIVGTLPAPVAGVPGTGIAAGVKYKKDAPGKGKMVATDTRYNIVNYDSRLTASDGTFAKIELLEGKWDCYWVGCGPETGLTGLDPTP